LADQTVIQDLVVRVTGDPSNFYRTMADAATEARGLGNAVKASAGDHDALTHSHHELNHTIRTTRETLHLYGRQVGGEAAESIAKLGEGAMVAKIALGGLEGGLIGLGVVAALELGRVALEFESLEKKISKAAAAGRVAAVEVRASLTERALTSPGTTGVEDLAKVRAGLEQHYREQVERISEMTFRRRVAEAGFDRARLNEEQRKDLEKFQETPGPRGTIRIDEELKDAIAEAAKARSTIDNLSASIVEQARKDVRKMGAEAEDEVKNFEKLPAQILKSRLEMLRDSGVVGLQPQIDKLAPAIDLQASMEVTKAVRDARLEIATFGLSAEESRLATVRFNAELRGIPVNTAELGRELDRLKQLKLGQRISDSMLADLDELFSMADEVINSVKTPLEKYRETVYNLGEMFRVGAIPTQELYNRALEAAAKQFDEAQQAARGLHSELQKLTTVRFGGQEFAGEAYRQRFGALAGPTLGASAAREQVRQYQSGVSGKAERLLEQVAANTRNLAENMIGLAEANF
jgi:hypothetical protein